MDIAAASDQDFEYTVAGRLSGEWEAAWAWIFYPW